MSTPNEQLLKAARELWTDIAAAPVTFPDRGISVVASAGSRMCPPGWVGLVVLGDTGIATTPDEATAHAMHTRLAECTPQRLYRSGVRGCWLRCGWRGRWGSRMSVCRSGRGWADA
ncbi:hypothetical protein ABH935_005931 [Catenulispora sp. GAS73]|uniref:hypothetical protein n=1 Tax=Catenulispora sp. GAS73 TaxID=3156269 RepID=UPI003516DA9A